MAKKKATKVARPPQEGVMETPNPRSKRVKLSQVKTEEAARPDAVASAVTPDTATSCTSVAAFSRPTPGECQWAVNVLSEIHPEVVERNKSRRRATHSCGAQDDIVDGVVSTMLSQNTTSANSTAAFRNLKQVFPTWEEYIETADNVPKLQEAIRCGGLAERKSKRIHEMLTTLQEERGSPSLEYLRQLSNDEIKEELSRFKGLGPKTISCVLLFTLGRDEMPVDTHVHRISKKAGWISASTNAENAYLHLNKVVPDSLKLDLHCLLIAHAKSCYRCAARGKPQFPPKIKVPCPLVHIHKQKGLVVPIVNAATVRKEFK
jgi:endonuclease-3